MSERLETRLRGAMQEVAAAAPPAAPIADPQHGDGVARHRKGPLLVAAAVLVVAGGTATLAQVARDSDSGPQQGAESYAGPGGVSPTPSPNPDANVDDLAARISAHENARGFGQVEVDYEHSTVVVRWNGVPPGAVRNLRGTHANGLTVKIWQSDYPRKVLEQASVKLVRDLPDELGRDRLAGVLAEPDMSGIVAEIVPPWNGDVGDLEVVAGVPVRVAFVDDLPQPLGSE